MSIGSLTQLNENKSNLSPDYEDKHKQRSEIESELSEGVTRELKSR